MSMQSYRYIIIGTGVAGASAAEGIRQIDNSSPVLLIGREPQLPYHRPPLSKQLWFGKKKPADIFVHDEAWYRQNGIDVAVDTTITAINPDSRTVVDQRNNSFRYEKLLLATGGQPRMLGIPGGDMPEIFYFRTLDDYTRLRQLAIAGTKALVIGGGFIGSEMAAALRTARVDVTMLFPDPSLVPNVFPASLSQAITRNYKERRVRILAGDTPAVIRRSGRGFAVETRNGQRIDCDWVVAGIGIVPEMHLASGIGLQVGNGVVVNEHLQSSDPNIFAAGDNALFPYEALGYDTRVEHWDNAVEQGRCAGRNMAGAGQPYTHMPYFFSDLFDFGYEAVGAVHGLQTFADWRKENDTGVIYHLLNGRVRGVMLCNVWGKVDAARELIRQDRTWTPAELRGLIRDEAWQKEERLSLAAEKSQPVTKATPPLSPDEAEKLAHDVPDWMLRGNALERDFKFRDFDQAMGFVNRVADVAREEDHHPDISVSYNKVHLALSTHKIGGLTKNDFIVAAKINQLAQ